MTTYQDYKSQIAELEKLAETARIKERSEGLAYVFEVMQERGVSLADLVEHEKGQKHRRKTQAPAPVKYLDDSTGETWTGRGRTPRWLDGKDKSLYLV